VLSTSTSYGAGLLNTPAPFSASHVPLDSPVAENASVALDPPNDCPPHTTPAIPDGPDVAPDTATIAAPRTQPGCGCETATDGTVLSTLTEKLPDT